MNKNEWLKITVYRVNIWQCPDRVIISIMAKPFILQYKKLYLTDFVQNSIRFNMSIIILTSDLIEAARGQKYPSEAKNVMKESMYWKKFLIKVGQQPLKPLDVSNQIWVMNSVKKDRSQQPAR